MAAMNDINMDDAAVLIAIGYDGEIINSSIDTEIPTDDLAAWLRKIADDMEQDAC